MKPAYDCLFFSTAAQVFIFYPSPTTDHPTTTMVYGSRMKGFGAVSLCWQRSQSDNDILVPGRSGFSFILFTILLISHVYKNTFLYMYTF